MEHDRTYYRHCETRQLIELARDSDHELCIALGERLEDLENADDERAELTTELHHARKLIDRLRDQIIAYETAKD